MIAAKIDLDVTHQQSSRSHRDIPSIVDDLDGQIGSRLERAKGIRTELQVLDTEIAQLRHARAAITIADAAAAINETSASGRSASDAVLIRFHAAKAIILAGRPLNRSEILDYMTREGVKLAAKDPGLRIGKVLWRSKDFVSAGDGYWPAAHLTVELQD